MGFKARSVTRRLVRALVSTDPGTYAPLLADDVELRLWRWDGIEAHGSRALVTERLVADASSWSDARVELNRVASPDTAEFTITAGSEGARVAHHRCLVVEHTRGRASRIDYYCAVPMTAPAAPGEVLSASLSDERIDANLPGVRPGDLRRVPLRGRFIIHGLDLHRTGYVQADPTFNLVHGSRFGAEEADERIRAIIAWHRARGRGFTWYVGPGDRPGDLSERLERHGLVHDGSEATMVRRLPGAPTIPRAADVELRPIDGTDPALNETALQIIGLAFEWDDARVDAVRKWWPDRMRTRGIPFPRSHYLAYIDGRAVGFASLSLCAGFAQLNGAAVVPAFRRRGVYTTLMAARLDDAAAAGFELASSSAMPASQTVMERHGFVARGRIQKYRWDFVLD